MASDLDAAPAPAEAVPTPSPVAAYAPSPNTSQQAVGRAGQLRIQTLLRRLLAPMGQSILSEEWRRSRVDTLRVLRKTLRELDFQMSWITQVDFLETMERILREDNEQQRPPEQLDWRLIHDCTQLLIESIPSLVHEVDGQTLEQIVPMVVQNLGHERSEVRRASLLLMNMLINEKRQHFRLLMRLFIDFGLANYCHEQAQRGAILSLPLLMSEQVVEREDLQPLIRCLSGLLIESKEQLFYSLYLALQRLHSMMGDERFAAHLRHCEPEAMHLYKQAASRNNSLVASSSVNGAASERRRSTSTDSKRRRSSTTTSCQRQQGPAARATSLRRSTPSSSQHVTFENDLGGQSEEGQLAQPWQGEGALTCEERAASQETEEERAAEESAPKQATGPPEAAAPRAATQREHSDTASPLTEDDETTAQKGATTDDGRRQQQQWKRMSHAGSSDVSSTCSSDAHLVDPAHYMSQAALGGRPMDNYEQIHHIDHSNIAGLAINDMGPVCNTPTIELGPGGLASVDVEANDSSGTEEGARGGKGFGGGHGEMKFGIFPRHLVQIALGGSPRHSDRLDAMQELMCIIRESPINHLAILMTYFDTFLDQFLSRLIQQSADYKLELMAVDMIESIVIKTKVSTMQYVRPIVGLLVKTLADSHAQQMFRAQTCRVLHKMMAYLPPQHVIDALFEHKHSRNVLVREEAINRVTGAVLEFNRNEFNLTKLCYHVLPMLADSHSSVRLAALECIATLAHALGPERIGSLLTAAEAVQTGCDYDGLLDAINARLKRHMLPRLNSSDGSIRHVLRPFLSSSAAQQLEQQQQLAADVRWVLEAPSTHQHSPGPFYKSHQEHQHQQHHRLGVYSPPNMAERQRRRSSIGLVGLSGESERPNLHHHHHRLHHHQRSQQQPQESSDDEKDPRGPSSQATRPLPTKSVDNEQQSGHQRRKSCDLRKGSNTNSETLMSGTLAVDDNLAETKLEAQHDHHEHHAAPPVQPEHGSGQRQRQLRRQSGHFRDHQSGDSGTFCGQQEQQQQQQQALHQALACKRSNSQDSISSTDTNKVLFQYYLGKFKQSLAEATLAHQAPQAVLPSDSIIYTDINQAYALGRHQSRYQQTSFEERDATAAGEQVGRQAVPSNSIGPTVRKAPASSPPHRQRQASPDDQSSQNNEEEALGRLGDAETASPDTSASDSPLTVMENSSNQQATEPTIQEGGRRSSLEAQSPAGGDGKSTEGEHRRSSQQSQEAAASEQRHDGAAEESSPQPARRQSLACQQQQQAPKRALVRQEASAASAVEGERHSTGSGGGQHLGRQASDATTATSSSLESCEQRTSRRRSSSSRKRLSEAQQEVEDRRQSQESEALSKEVRRRASKSQPPSRGSISQQQQQQQQRSQPDKGRATSRAPSKQSFSQSAKHNGGNSGDTPAPQSCTDHGSGRPRRAISVSPSLACNVNIRHILENVAEIEGPFPDPRLALKVCLDAIESPCWSTKVEGMMALIRLINFHQQVILNSGHLHELVCRVADETQNLRSTVARSAIFALGELCAKLKRSIEPEMEFIVQALLQKAIENTAFIRDDIRRSLAQMVETLTPWRLINALIHHGAQHKSVHVRRMASQFVAQLADRMGPAKCLVGAKEISSQLIPAAARFAQDSSPFTRYYGRSILAKLMQHGSFDRLLRHNLTPNLFRSTLGIIESVKRRGPGELPTEN